MNEDELTLRVLSPDGPLLEADRLLEVLIPLVDGGPIGIRPRHASLIAETVSGPIRYQTETELFEVELMAGILSIRDNVVTILSAGEMTEAETSPESTSDPHTKLAQTLETERDVSEGDQ